MVLDNWDLVTVYVENERVRGHLIPGVLVAEIERLRSELEAAHEKLKYYDSVVYFDGRKIALHDEHEAVAVDPERVSVIVTELRALRAVRDAASIVAKDKENTKTTKALLDLGEALAACPREEVKP